MLRLLFRSFLNARATNRPPPAHRTAGDHSMPSFYAGPTLSLEQVAQVAYQAGARGSDLEFLTALPTRESWYTDPNTGVQGANTGAHRTDSARGRLSGDRGIWQINYTWDDELRQAGIIRSAQDLFNPVVNAKAAIYVLRKQGRDAWAMATSGRSAYQSGGDPLRGLNVPAAQQAVRRAANQGLLGNDWNNQGQSAAGGAAASGGGGGGVGGTAQAPTDLPRDARLLRFDWGGLYAIFDLGNNLFIRYRINPASTNIGGRSIERLSNAQISAKYGAMVDGGNAEELKSIPTGFGTYRAFWDSILNQTIGTTNPARNDPEVRRVLAEFAARPNMTEAEFDKRLKTTNWFQSRTERELRWNDLSEAQRQLEMQETASRLSDTWREFMGTTMSVSELLGPRRQWVENVASGKVGMGWFIEDVVKPRAENNPESPWMRLQRDELEAQRQRGVDIENTASRIRQTARRWGLGWTEKTLLKRAQAIVEGRLTDLDLEKQMEQQAKTLYPWLPAGIETIEAATPWLETYRGVMEKEGSLFTPEIQRSMRVGQTMLDFEEQLKSTPAYWNETTGAREEAFELVGRVGQTFGFNR